jgi:hypothetical protein
MLSLPRLRNLILACAVSVTLFSAGSTRGQGKGGSNDVEFKTFDGVRISGKLYAGAGGKGKPDACVLLIPNFDLKKGGGIQQEGYDELAKGLQDEGYTVLSFDFRGFGDSKTVDPLVFWKQSHNNPNFVRRRMVGGKLPEKIDHKDFLNTNYVQYFVNDIAAAKAFLDQENDNKTCNSSNVVVIGAGYGATLGAMWIANECRRRKDLAGPLAGVPMLGDIESENIAGAVWLSLQPSLPGGKQVPLTKWIIEGGKAHKIPMAFIHGKGDTVSGGFSARMSEAIKGKGKNKDYEFTGAKEIDNTKLVGNQLLQNALGTQKWILEKYLNPVMSKRTMKRRTERKVEPSQFFYTRPNGAILRLNKPAGAKVPGVDVQLMMNP